MILARSAQNNSVYFDDRRIDTKQVNAMWHIQEKADATTSLMICGNMLPTDITEAIILRDAKIGTKTALCGYCLQQLDFYIDPEIRAAKLMGR